MKLAVITGVAGQDGSYLAEYLLLNNYRVVGITKRRGANPDFSNLNNVISNTNFELHYGDMCDPVFMSRIFDKYQGQISEFYHLGAASNVGTSFSEPMHVIDTNAKSTILHLELIRSKSPYTRYYFAATSEIFGGVDCPENGYNEDSKINPRSPYAISKATSYYSVINSRSSYDLYAVNGILFNHSSPRRGLDFATRKITRGVAAISKGFQNYLYMGNVEAKRDEGNSKDYVRVMHDMLQLDNPEDFVIATGETVSIKKMISYVAEEVGLSFDDIYRLDERFMRPSDVPILKGDSSKARELLAYSPTYHWKDTLSEMLQYDLGNSTVDKMEL